MGFSDNLNVAWEKQIFFLTMRFSFCNENHKYIILYIIIVLYNEWQKSIDIAFCTYEKNNVSGNVADPSYINIIPR